MKQEQASRTTARWLETLNTCPLSAGPRPGLLFDGGQLSAFRNKADARPGMLDRLRARADVILSKPAGQADVLQPYLSGAEAVRLAEYYVLTGDDASARWIRERVAALLALDSWFSPVHVGSCRCCDHVMANVGAQVGKCVDFLGEAYSAAERAAVVKQMRPLLFDPFLDGTAANPEWWYRIRMNWMIMTCGDTGLAATAFADELPDARLLLSRAAIGVLNVLDEVPPEGDWNEGVHYWFGTLRYGLQFARALRRLTGGAVNLFDHPALKITGDYLVALTTPAGRVYNFSDGDPDYSPELAEVLAMLGAEIGRGDWLGEARRRQGDTLGSLVYDDTAIASGPLTRLSASFPSTGVATMRSGWSEPDVFVGFKSSPSTAPHGHLDANAFVIEAAGQPLVPDYPYWPQAHFLGYFDTNGPRWNFDGMATVGHSTLLVDGMGQAHGPDRGGRLVEARDEGSWARVMGDASSAYPGVLTKFIRTLLYVRPGVIVIRDVVECEGERRLEWLLHHAGTVRDEGQASVVVNGPATLTVVPFLPDRGMGWRVSDVVRASTYECSDTRQVVRREIRYRSFSVFRPSRSFEFLFGLQVGGGRTEAWTFSKNEKGWMLKLPGGLGSVRPQGDGLVLTRAV